MYLRCMIRLFNGNRSVVLFLLPFFIGVFYLLNYYFSIETAALVRNDAWWGVEFNESSVFSQILAFCFVFGNSVLINFIFNHREFKDRNMYMPSLLYVLGHSFYHSFYFFSAQSILSTFILLMLYQVFQLDQNSDGRKRSFNIGFFLGLGVLVYPAFALVAVPLQIGIWVLRPFVFREILLFFAGITVPMLYLIPFSFYYKVDLWKMIFDFDPLSTNHFSLLILAVLLLVFSLMGFPKLFQRNSNSSIKLKKYVRVLIIFTLTLLGFSLVEFLTYSIWEATQLILIPLVFLLCYIFDARKVQLFDSFIVYLLLLISLGKFFLIDSM